MTNLSQLWLTVIQVAEQKMAKPSIRECQDHLHAVASIAKLGALSLKGVKGMSQ